MSAWQEHTCGPVDTLSGALPFSAAVPALGVAAAEAALPEAEGEAAVPEAVGTLATLALGSPVFFPTGLPSPASFTAGFTTLLPALCAAGCVTHG